MIVGGIDVGNDGTDVVGDHSRDTRSFRTANRGSNRRSCRPGRNEDRPARSTGRFLSYHRFLCSLSGVFRAERAQNYNGRCRWIRGWSRGVWKAAGRSVI